MKPFYTICFTFLCIICVNKNYAQGGGPPMLTDDPATLHAKTWEINTSVNTQVTKEIQLAIPYVDANYGITNCIQLKIEMPYLITIDEQKHVSGKLVDPLIGVKYSIVDEDKHFISVSTYPQATITGNQKIFLLPLLFAKTIGRFVVDEEIGYSIVLFRENQTTC